MAVKFAVLDEKGAPDQLKLAKLILAGADAEEGDQTPGFLALRSDKGGTMLMIGRREPEALLQEARKAFGTPKVLAKGALAASGATAILTADKPAALNPERLRQLFHGTGIRDVDVRGTGTGPAGEPVDGNSHGGQRGPKDDEQVIENNDEVIENSDHGHDMTGELSITRGKDEGDDDGGDDKKGGPVGLDAEDKKESLKLLNLQLIREKLTSEIRAFIEKNTNNAILFGKATKPLDFLVGTQKQIDDLLERGEVDKAIRLARGAYELVLKKNGKDVYRPPQVIEDYQSADGANAQPLHLERAPNKEEVLRQRHAIGEYINTLKSLHDRAVNDLKQLGESPESVEEIFRSVQHDLKPLLEQEKWEDALNLIRQAINKLALIAKDAEQRVGDEKGL